MWSKYLLGDTKLPIYVEERITMHANDFLSIFMHGCSPIHVERSKSLLVFHGVRIWKFNLCKLNFEEKKSIVYRACVTFQTQSKKLCPSSTRKTNYNWQWNKMSSLLKFSFPKKKVFVGQKSDALTEKSFDSLDKWRKY